jgi:hypothetical protein
MSTEQPQGVPGNGRIPPGIDKGLGIIDDLGQGNDRRRRCSGRVAVAPNKPNFPRSWAENAGAARKQSQSARPRRPLLGIGDCRLGIGDWGLRVRWEGHSGDVGETQNKPNLPLLATSVVALSGQRVANPDSTVADGNTRYEIRAHRVDRMQNKANSWRF